MSIPSLLPDINRISVQLVPKSHLLRERVSRRTSSDDEFEQTELQEQWLRQHDFQVYSPAPAPRGSVATVQTWLAHAVQPKTSEGMRWCGNAFQRHFVRTKN